MNSEMMRALEADGEKLRQLTCEDHGPEFLGTCDGCGASLSLASFPEGEGFVCACKRDTVIVADKDPCEMNELAAARQWRESLGMSRAELGTLIGWSPQAIYLIEKSREPGKVFKRYKAACLLVAILKAANNPALSVDRWQWGLTQSTSST
jgi:DNA-binding XRE family transcriptional regulator